MNLVVPPVDHSDRSSEDELDGLLRAFYKAELPNPWPSFEAPADRNLILPLRPFGKRFPMWRTRLALAASVAFLVAGPIALSAYLSGTNTNTAAATVPESGPASADRKTNLTPHVIEESLTGPAINVKVTDVPSK
jgi:hypothetical protein